VTKFDDTAGDWTEGIAPLPATASRPVETTRDAEGRGHGAGRPGTDSNRGVLDRLLWCSVVGVVTVAPAILGIVFGFVARSRIKKSEGSLKGSGLALAGIVVGTEVLVLISVLGRRRHTRRH